MSFNTALSGLQAASGNLSVVANNVANGSTNGFKRSRAEFSDVYATSALGSGGQATGSGVLMSAVTQQFTQGQISFTSNSLDLAISGQGFFVLNNNGAISYSRAGAFGVDRLGNIANSAGDILTGFLADDSGIISGGRGDLRISTSNLAPRATSSLDMNVNLNGQDIPPLSPFVPGFTLDNPPASSTYNSSSATTIYDSLGNAHILTAYFVKAHTQNTWRVYVGVDGVDFTPTEAALPIGTPPQSYPVGSVAKPFTVVFNPQGELVPFSASTPPILNPLPPVTSTLIPPGPFNLLLSETMPTLELGDLVLNGIPIDAATDTADPFSTQQARASAVSLAAAINASTQKHGVTATPNAATFTIGTLTSAAPITIASGELVINNVDITSAAAGGPFAALTDLRDYLNTPAITAATGVTASIAAGSLSLTSNNGRNINVVSSGTAGETFSVFNIGGGSPLNRLQRGTITLNTVDNEGIFIEGANPNNAGLNFGDKFGIIYSSSDNIVIDSYTPGTGATSPQSFTVSLGTSTQFGSPFSVQALQQDGFSTGRLASVDVDSSGIIFARYSNGQSLALGQVSLANFSNQQGLSPLGGSVWAETFDSGTALIGAPGTASLGDIQSGSLEGSNVQISDELVSLIVAQRDFQANAQTIRTADTVTQTIINIR